MSVLVVVIAVSGVAVALMHVVNMIAVRNSDVTATLAVDMLVSAVSGVSGWLTLVIVTIVSFVQVTLMHVVNVVTMRDRDMTAALTVSMAVAGVFDVGRRHKVLLSYTNRARHMSRQLELPHFLSLEPIRKGFG